MGIIIRDGQTRSAVVPGNPPLYEKFTITYRPLASYEYELFRTTTGPAQVRMMADKLQSWSLIMDADTAKWCGAEVTNRVEQAGAPLPIHEKVLLALDGTAFERIYMGLMGLLADGKQQTSDAVKN